MTTRAVATGDATLTMSRLPSGRPPRRLDDLGEQALARITGEALVRADLASPEEARRRIGEILVMAQEWAAGRLPLTEVGRLCTPVERFLAVRFGARPVPVALLALVDAFIDVTPGPDGCCYRTPYGIYTERDVAAAHGTYHREPDGRIRIVFPLSTERAEGEQDRWR